jgi:predicted RNA binding protein YcfA (HicA-like mRNA interferase family)
VTPKQPRVTAAQVIAVLMKAGFALSRQTGSHRIYKNAQGKRVTVPFHASTILHPKVLKSILLDTGLTIEEFVWFLNS